MEVKTNVYLSETDIISVIKKHLEKTGFKVIGELEIIVKSDYDKINKNKGLAKGDKIGISVEVQKKFGNRISLANEKK
jgi:hypothetical protein